MTARPESLVQCWRGNDSIDVFAFLPQVFLVAFVATVFLLCPLCALLLSATKTEHQKQQTEELNEEDMGFNLPTPQEFYPPSPFYPSPHHTKGIKFIHPRRESLGDRVSRLWGDACGQSGGSWVVQIGVKFACCVDDRGVCGG